MPGREPDPGTPRALRAVRWPRQFKELLSVSEGSGEADFHPEKIRGLYLSACSAQKLSKGDRIPSTLPFYRTPPLPSPYLCPLSLCHWLNGTQLRTLSYQRLQLFPASGSVICWLEGDNTRRRLSLFYLTI